MWGALSLTPLRISPPLLTISSVSSHLGRGSSERYLLRAVLPGALHSAAAFIWDAAVKVISRSSTLVIGISSELRCPRFFWAPALCREQRGYRGRWWAQRSPVKHDNTGSEGTSYWSAKCFPLSQASCLIRLTFLRMWVCVCECVRAEPMRLFSI